MDISEFAARWRKLRLVDLMVLPTGFDLGLLCEHPAEWWPATVPLLGLLLVLWWHLRAAFVFGSEEAGKDAE